MKFILSICIALWLYSTSQSAAAVGNLTSRKIKSTISLESRAELNGVSIFLKNEQAGIYRRFILEKSMDGTHYTEVARTDESAECGQGYVIRFRDFPFEKNSFATVFYRVRAVDELGWFDFSNIVSVHKKQDLASQSLPDAGLPAQGQF